MSCESGSRHISKQGGVVGGPLRAFALKRKERWMVFTGPKNGERAISALNWFAGANHPDDRAEKKLSS